MTSEVTPTPNQESLQLHRCWPLGTCLALGPDLQSCWPALTSPTLGLAPGTFPSCVPHPACRGAHCGGGRGWGEKASPEDLLSPGAGGLGRILGPQRPLLTHTPSPCPWGTPPGLCNSQSVPLCRGLGHGSSAHLSILLSMQVLFGQESPCKGDVDNHVPSHRSCCHSAACTEETESFSYSNKSMLNLRLQNPRVQRPTVYSKGYQEPSTKGLTGDVGRVVGTYQGWDPAGLTLQEAVTTHRAERARGGSSHHGRGLPS